MNKIVKWMLIVFGIIMTISILLHLTVLFGANYDGVFLIDNIHDLVHGI